MFIEDIREDFYNVVRGKRILVIVNYDIDAVCATRIVQHLFNHDNMITSIVPILGISGMQRAYNEHRDDVKYVLLLNCGGCVDILETLEPDDEDTVFFVCDSHRPFDVCNIYNDGQIRLINPAIAQDGIPEFDSIFRDSDGEDEDEDADNDDEDGGGDRMDRFEERIRKRNERRKWEEDRDRIMFNYVQFSAFGRSSALTFFEMAWKMSKDNLDLLWWATVGLTEQLLLGRIESSTYTLECAQIQSHVSRLTNRATDQTQTGVKIVFEKDLHLALYRHWTIFDSLRHSVIPACRMQSWTFRGEKRLQELLVEMGLPLVQAKQSFGSMDLVMRKEFFDMVEKLAAKYGLEQLIYGSFTLHYGYGCKFSAADYVYSLIAKMETIDQDRLPEFCFLEAMDVLSRTNRGQLESGLEVAKALMLAIFRQVQTSLEMNLVRSAGPFFYYVLQEENKYFCYPYGLSLLARFVLQGFVSTSKKRRASDLPLVASSPIDVERGLTLMVGIPPVRENSPKNFFGKAFEQAAAQSKVTISQDFFDSSIIQIKQSDIGKFLDALTTLLS